MLQAKNSNIKKERMEEKEFLPVAGTCQGGSDSGYYSSINITVLLNRHTTPYEVTSSPASKWGGGGNNRFGVPYLMKRRMRMLTLVWRANWPQAHLREKMWDAEGKQVSWHYVVPRNIKDTAAPLWGSWHTIISTRAISLRAQNLNICFILMLSRFVKGHQFQPNLKSRAYCHILPAL